MPGTAGAVGWSPCLAPVRELGLCLRVLGITRRKAACGGETRPVLVSGRPLAPPQVTYPSPLVCVHSALIFGMVCSLHYGELQKQTEILSLFFSLACCILQAQVLWRPLLRAQGSIDSVRVFFVVVFNS